MDQTELTSLDGSRLKGLALRGGAWNNNHRNARVADRNNDHPDNDWNNNGFRVVALHGFAKRNVGWTRWHLVLPCPTLRRKCSLTKVSGRGKTGRRETRPRLYFL